MTIRTSTTHPLRVDFLPDALLPGQGRLGLTLAPGKHEARAQSGTWQRDLNLDLARLVNEERADVLVTLNTQPELDRLRIAELPGRAREAGLEHLHFPFEDAGIPDDLEAFRHLVEKVRWRVRLGRTVVVHCKGGLGRSGLVAGCVLVAAGAEPEEAVREVRAARPGAIETAGQKKVVLDYRGVLGEGEAFDRTLGCLLGGAVGDALGAGIEFMAWSEIERRHGAEGVTDYVEAYGRRGAITDDTQMTLFTAEGILRAIQRQRRRGVCAPESVVHHGLFRWLLTQGQSNEWLRERGSVTEGGEPFPDGWLIQTEELHSRRAPGNTCLGSLTEATIGERVENDSKGCGGVMRSAPMGLFPRHEGLSPFHLAAETSRLTHGHPSGYLAAGFFAEVVLRLRKGEPIAESIEATLLEHRGDLNSEVIDAVDAAVRGAKLKPPTSRRETLTSLGEGWVAEEALAIALYCALVAEDFRDGVLLAVNHSGDSDSTGAIAGNLLGVMHGTSGFPVEWLEELEARDVIEALARDIVHADSGAEMDEDRYPGW